MSMYVLSIMHKILYKNGYVFAFTNSIFFSIYAFSLNTLQEKEFSHLPKRTRSRRRIKDPLAGTGPYFFNSSGNPTLLQAVYSEMSHISYHFADYVRPISHQPPDLHLQYRSDASSP